MVFVLINYVSQINYLNNIIPNLKKYIYIDRILH